MKVKKIRNLIIIGAGCVTTAFSLGLFWDIWLWHFNKYQDISAVLALLN